MSRIVVAVSRGTVSLVLAAVAGMHLLPLYGVLGAERLTQLYGVTADEPNLALLLRHRAVLFGLLGAFMLAAVWRPAWRTPALAAGCISVGSFLMLAALGGELHAELKRVVRIDAAAAVALALAAALQALRREPAPG